MDSGGGKGLPYRLEQAADLSIEILAAVRQDDLASGDAELDSYFAKHRKELIAEAATSELIIKPASEVFVVIDGQKQFEGMVTLLKKGAEIFVADNLAATDPFEIATNIIHEYGHHLGLTENEDTFLDRLAVAIVKRALQVSPALRMKAQACIPTYEYMGLMAGKWQGTMTKPAAWNGPNPMPIEIIFSADGGYSDRNLCGDKIANCVNPFYWGVAGPMPNKKILIEEACGGKASATFNLVFSETHALQLNMRQIELKDAGNKLYFEIFREGTLGPILYELERVSQ